MNFKRISLLIFFATLFSVLSYVSTARASVLGFDTSTPCTYWEDVFNFGMSVAGILTLVMLVVGGLYYMVSLGQEEKLGNAKSMMGGAMVGFILAIFSWMVFNIISPSLLQCRLDIPEIDLGSVATGDYGSNGPGGPSDPCAGVADEDLFASRDLCESSECDGRCLEIPSIPEDTDDSSDEEGGGTSGDGNDDESDGSNGGGDSDSGDGDGDSADEDDSGTSITNVGRAGKFCCAGGGTCNNVLEYIDDGRIGTRGRVREDFEMGMRECRWTMRSSCPATAGACDGYSREVPIDQRICSLLIDIVDNGGLTPTVTNLVRGHGRCRRCSNPNTDNPCNRDSSHWHGAGMDLAKSDDIQRWIAENSSGLASLYGPLGMPGDQRGMRESQQPCPSQRFSSEYFINMGRRPGSIGGGTVCSHRQHIHLDFNF